MRRRVRRVDGDDDDAEQEEDKKRERGHTLRHVHLAAALADDALDPRVRDGRPDPKALLVDLAQLLVVLHLAVHLDLEGVHLELRRALGRVDVGAVVRGRALGVKLLEDLRARAARERVERGGAGQNEEDAPCSGERTRGGRARAWRA